MNSITNLSPTELRQAADLQEQIQELQKQLNNLLGNGQASTPAVTEAPQEPRKRKMSAAGRRAIAAAAKARWAKYNAEKMEPVTKGKRLSAQGLANIRAGVAKRMAARGEASGTKATEKAKRKMSPAWKAALERAWAARRAKSK
jgi:hypothetical protein